MKVAYYFMLLCMLVGVIHCYENDEEISTSYQEDGTDDADDVEETPTFKEESERNDVDEKDEGETADDGMIYLYYNFELTIFP